MAGTNVTNQPEVERVVLVFTILYGRILQISISECPPTYIALILESQRRLHDTAQHRRGACQDAAGKYAPAGVTMVMSMVCFLPKPFSSLSLSISSPHYLLVCFLS